jgi:hypothetical protein
MDWKPSVALLPQRTGPPLVVSAGGRGTTAGSQTGDYGVCNAGQTRAWVGAFRPDGTAAWAVRYDEGTGLGNVRASVAVADLDGDGRFEEAVAFGCRGEVRFYRDDGTEIAAWRRQLGDPLSEPTQRSIASPSIGDVDGDGWLDVIVSSFDGKVTCWGVP